MMLMVEVTEKKETETHLLLKLSCGQHKAEILVRKGKTIYVCCLNKSHDAWKGIGKTFHDLDWDKALASYKSKQMKEMINMARELAA